MQSSNEQKTNKNRTKSIALIGWVHILWAISSQNPFRDFAVKKQQKRGENGRVSNGYYFLKKRAHQYLSHEPLHSMDYGQEAMGTTNNGTKHDSK